MTDRETLDRARLLFVGDTQGDRLARQMNRKSTTDWRATRMRFGARKAQKTARHEAHEALVKAMTAALDDGFEVTP